jgi:signal transduction histidine kinase
VLEAVRSVSTLAELLLSQREAVIERWAARVEPLTLRESAAALLNALVGMLAGSQSRSRLQELVDGAPMGRDALYELTVLRGVVLELVSEQAGELDPVEATLFHRAVDDLLLAFAERAFERQRLELEMRARFVSVLGHDLRNPISAIKLGSSMLVRDVQSPDARKRTAERIVSSANRMLRMLEDLLDFMRLRPGALPQLELGSVSLNDLCREVIDQSLAAHPKRAITFSADAESTGRFDRRRLGQALANVISSALDHSPAQSEVQVVLRAGAIPCISVRHLGPVIPATELDTIFDPLRRGDLAKSNDRPARGLGLGLFLAEQIVRAHGGRISAESSAEAGTTFSLHLPSHAND